MKIIFFILIIIASLFSTEKKINIKIVNSNNIPISNANVYCGTNGTISNKDGYSTIICNENDILQIKHISYNYYQKKVSELDNIIIMTNADILLDDIVVYGGIGKTEYAGNIKILSSNQSKSSIQSHFESLINSIPEVHYSSGTSRARYFQIRGIGELSQFSGEGAPHFYISTIIDNIDFSGIGGVTLLDDIKQIEIFKGPQSTIYGPNAMGGAINFISKKAHNNKEFKTSFKIGNYNTNKIAATLNLPLTEYLSSRITFSQSTTDGMIYNEYLESNDSNSKNENMIKLSFNYNANKNKNIILFAYHINLDNKYNQWTPDNNGFTTYSDYQGYDKQKTNAFSITKTNKINNLTITNISSYSKSNIQYSYDADWGNLEYWASSPYNWYENNTELFSEESCNLSPGYYPCYFDYYFSDLTNREKKIKSKEIRFAFKNIITGFYFSNLKEIDIRDGWIFAGNAENIHSTFKISNSSIYLKFKKILNKTKINTTFRYDYYRTKNILTYSIYNWETSEYDYYYPDDSLNEDKLIGANIDLNHEINQHNKINISLSKGHKTSGINQSPNFPNNKYYNNEDSYNLEFGYTTSRKNINIKLTTFYLKRINPQLRLFAQHDTSNPTSFDYATFNGDKGKSYGFESSLSLKINHIITCNSSLSYLKAYINSFEFNGVNYGDREPAHSPKFNYNINLLFNFNHLIDGLSINLEKNHTDKFYFDDQNSHMSKPYSIINTNIIYQINKNINFIVWGKNITDEIYATRGYTFILDPTWIERDYKSYGDRKSLGISINYNLIK